MKQAKEKLDAYIKSGKREHLSLNVPKFLESYAQEYFEILSEDEVEAACTDWKLFAIKHKVKTAGRYFLFLVAVSELECAARFELDYSFRLSNADPSKDIRKAGKEFLDFRGEAGKDGHVKLQEIEIKDLVDPKKGFVREDGSIRMELDFTIVKATIEGEDDAEQASSSKK